MTDPESDERARVRAGLEEAERRIDAACKRVGRNRSEVSLLPVTKTVSAACVAEAIALGCRQFGENRVQEASAKAQVLARHDVDWHIVGHLQRNKVKSALAVAACIQTIDRASLVQRVADQLAEQGERRQVLLQVNTSGASSQYGVMPAAIEPLADAVAARPELEWTGLMTIGRFCQDPEDTRDCFRLLHGLRERLQDRTGQSLPVLSMGMSNDLEVAVEEGATLVRAGGAVFGARE